MARRPLALTVEDQYQRSGAAGKKRVLRPGGFAVLSTSRCSSAARGSRQAMPSTFQRLAASAVASARSSSMGLPLQVLPVHCMPSTQRGQASPARRSCTVAPSGDKAQSGDVGADTDADLDADG
ncbi:hypothetical protein D3C71_1636840 [compost metagenome]